MAGIAKRSFGATFLFEDGPEDAAEERLESPPLVPVPEHGSMTIAELDALARPAGAAADEDDGVPIGYEPRPLKSRKKERKALGKPGKRSTCFLCAYVGERDATIPSDDIQKIIEMLRQGIGSMDSSVLAQQVADYYADFRARINRQLMAGETPLPAMNAATVLEHIRKHQQDFEVKQTIVLEELQELRETLMDSVLEQHPKTKQIRGNLTQLAALEKVLKMELLVHSKDPSKQSFYSAGARMDPAKRNRGPVNSNMKSLYSYWKQ